MTTTLTNSVFDVPNGSSGPVVETAEATRMATIRASRKPTTTTATTTTTSPTATPKVNNTAEDSPSRRSRRGRKNKGKSDNSNSGTAALEMGSFAQAVNGENMMYSVWGNEIQLLEEALAMQTASLHSREDDALRRFAVDHLEALLGRWSPSKPSTTNETGHGVKLPPRSNPWDRTKSTLITFGSYRLGVHRADSDLDLLALCPPEYSRADFFQSWVELLRKDTLVSKVHPIPQAYTPVIKFYFNNKIQVDMLFARVADGTKLREFQQRRVSSALRSGNGLQKNVPTTANTIKSERVEYMIDDSDLKEQDEAGVRSLNGARVSQMLLESVPDLSKFRTVLRAVKEWAVAKGIYSNVLGFLGGVNFAILAAWICQKYPHADAPTLLRYFFRTFCSWAWPTPVALLPIQSQPPDGAPMMPAWDPQRYPRDGLHLMPIVTPAYPSMNSTYNVGISQLRRIQEEMFSACNLLDFAPQPPPSIRQGGNRNNVFSALFEPSDFFAQHGHFLQITIRASNEQDFLEWFRLVESRLRLMIANMETPELKVYPYSHYFERKYDSEGHALGGLGRSDKDNLHESIFFIALRYARGVENFHLIPLTSDFLHKVNSWQQRKRGMDLSLAELTQPQLPEFIRPALKKQRADVYQKENTRSNNHNYNNNSYSYKKNHYNNYNRNSHGSKPGNHNHRGINAHKSSNHSASEESSYVASASSSFVSEDRTGETEETQSMGSDVSLADSSCSSSGGFTEGNYKPSRLSPMKRICVYNVPVAANSALPEARS